MDNIAQEPLEPSFDSILTAGEREEIQKAHRWAYKAILGVVEGFKSAPPNSSHWQNYFATMDRTATERIGPDWWQRKATVEEVFRKMAVMMCKNPFVTTNSADARTTCSEIQVSAKEGRSTSAMIFSMTTGCGSAISRGRTGFARWRWSTRCHTPLLEVRRT